MAARTQIDGSGAEIDYRFLVHRMAQDEREFSMDFMLAGPQFLYSNIHPTAQKQFGAGFDELVHLGCHPKTLASALFKYWRSRVVHPLFLSGKQVKALRTLLSEAKKEVEVINRGDILDLLGLQKPHHRPRLDELIRLLQWNTDSFCGWYRPRKDVVQSYGPVAVCMYSRLATGRFHFPTVLTLLETLGYKPNPNRRRRIKDKREGYEGYDSPCDSLERNYRNFVTKHLEFARHLQLELDFWHNAEDADMREPYSEYKRYRRYFKWDIMFACKAGTQHQLPSDVLLHLLRFHQQNRIP